MFGLLEVQIIKAVDDMEETERAGWANAHFLLLVRAFYVHKSKFAAEALVTATVTGIGEVIRNL
jgi:hypothetical protein